MGSLPAQDICAGQRRRIRRSLCRETEYSIVDARANSRKVGFAMKMAQSRLQPESGHRTLGMLAASDTIALENRWRPPIRRTDWLNELLRNGDVHAHER
jgi:hypothetical protein